MNVCRLPHKDVERGILVTPDTPHLNESTPHSLKSVWPRPGKESLVDVDRAVVVTVHHYAAVPTAIRSLPQGHVFFVPADMAGPGRIALVDDMEFFPKTQTLALEHQHKAVEAPIIIHQAVADVPLAPTTHF
jgi:hypothetical protein